jgi:cyclophilin family peptidyl-prolyl cis-trans isomerase
MVRVLVACTAMMLGAGVLAQEPAPPPAVPAGETAPATPAEGATPAAQAAETAPSGPAVPAAPKAAFAIAPAEVASDPQNTLHLDLSTGGRVSIVMRPDVAPAHVERIRTLARRGFYDGTIFHRVIEGFMAQGGDPTGTGTGGSDLPDLKAEFSTLPHLRGTASMARTDNPDSANSQFFIMLMPNTAQMDGKYTAWGRVIAGMQHVDQIDRGEPPANPTRIVKASIGADNVPPPVPQAVAAAPEPPAN